MKPAQSLPRMTSPPLVPLGKNRVEGEKHPRCPAALQTVSRSMSLPRRVLGDTSLEVSVLGYGASPLGAVFDSESFDVDEGIKSVHEAFKLGINLFDTSPFYGVTKSEQVLGRALKGLPRSEIVLATKVGRYGEAEFDFSAKRVTESVRESMGRLGVDYIDLLQCHDIEFTNLDQIVNETLPALQQLKKDGVVKNIGITGLPLKVYNYVLDKVEPGTVDVVLSYCHHTLLDNTLMQSIPYFKSKNVGVINASPLSMALLSPQGPPSWHPAPQNVKDAAQNAANLCKEKGVSLPKLGLMHSVECEDIATTLVGMPTISQVQHNVQSVLEALGVAERDPSTKAKEDECMTEIQKLFDPIMNISWPSGLPENN